MNMDTNWGVIEVLFNIKAISISCWHDNYVYIMSPSHRAIVDGKKERKYINLL